MISTRMLMRPDVRDTFVTFGEGFVVGVMDLSNHLQYREDIGEKLKGVRESNARKYRNKNRLGDYPYRNKLAYVGILRNTCSTNVSNSHNWSVAISDNKALDTTYLTAKNCDGAARIMEGLNAEEE